MPRRRWVAATVTELTAQAGAMAGPGTVSSAIQVLTVATGTAASGMRVVPDAGGATVGEVGEVRVDGRSLRRPSWKPRESAWSQAAKAVAIRGVDEAVAQAAGGEGGRGSGVDGKEAGVGGHGSSLGRVDRSRTGRYDRMLRRPRIDSARERARNHRTLGSGIRSPPLRPRHRGRRAPRAIRGAARRRCAAGSSSPTAPWARSCRSSSRRSTTSSSSRAATRSST